MMPNWKCRKARGCCAVALAMVVAGAGCGRKTEPTPAGVSMTPERLQDEVDRINADPRLTPGQKVLKIQMLRSHVTVADTAARR